MSSKLEIHIILCGVARRGKITLGEKELYRDDLEEYPEPYGPTTFNVTWNSNIELTLKRFGL